MQLELRQYLDGNLQRARLFAQARRHLQQNAMDLGLLVVEQPHQFVVLLDRLQRLDEHGLPARRSAMRHALHPPAVFHFHRNHKAFAANGDQFFLHRAAVGKPPQIRAQRLLDASLLLFDFAANARQLRRGAVVQRAIGKDLVAEVTQQGCEVFQCLRKFVYCLPLVLHGNWGMQCDLSPLRRAVGYQYEVANLGDLQGRALNARFVYQRCGSSRP